MTAPSNIYNPALLERIQHVVDDHTPMLKCHLQEAGGAINVTAYAYGHKQRAIYFEARYDDDMTVLVNYQDTGLLRYMLAEFGSYDKTASDLIYPKWRIEASYANLVKILTAYEWSWIANRHVQIDWNLPQPLLKEEESA